MSNVIDLPEKRAMTGLTLSFTLDHIAANRARIYAQIRLNEFAAAVAKLQKEGFPELKHTLISRQEYGPE